MTTFGRIAAIKAAAPEDSFFQGFGGSSLRDETMVFSLHNATRLGIHPPYSAEVRIPVRRKSDSVLDEYEADYGCFAGNSWDEVFSRHED